MSFSPGMAPDPELTNALRVLVRERKKLVFAAASNLGPHCSRPWPANQAGVFCIHATAEDAAIDKTMNLQPLGPVPGSTVTQPNLATLGCGILSCWDGNHESISGTSFATPVAAAIAANVLEYARRVLPAGEDQFRGYRNMKTLFLDHMTDNNMPGTYHKLKPWESLWNSCTSDNAICDVLIGISSGIK